MKVTKKKVAFAGVGVLVVALILGIKVSKQNSQQQTDQTVVSVGYAQKSDLTQTLKLSAVLEGTDSTEVVSNLHYEVSELFVQEGDRVEKGQLLARLDSTEVSRKIQSSNGNVKLLELQQEETLKNRQLELDNAQRDLENAQKNYDDIKALYDVGGASESELEEAANKLEDAKTAVNSIEAVDGKAVLSDAEKQSMANARLDASIQAETLNDCEIVSPIDGTVTRVNTKVGRFADDTESNVPMFVIENIDELQMKVLVSESDIGKVKVGQKVSVTADIIDGETVDAQVERISPTGEEKTGGTGGRVIPVYIKLTEKNENLIAGITAKATIITAEEKDVLTVPIEALAETEDGTEVVYTVTDENTIKIVPVTSGADDDINISVKGEGLEDGTRIVLNPSLALTEGMPVIAQ